MIEHYVRLLLLGDVDAAVATCASTATFTAGLNDNIPKKYKPLKKRAKKREYGMVMSTENVLIR